MKTFKNMWTCSGARPGHNEKMDRSCILVMVAAINEEGGIGSTLEEVKRMLNSPFCLVIDGRSCDNTARVARSCGAEVINQNGFGKGNALSEGLAYASRSDFDYVVFIDADYTYPVEHLPRMIGILEEDLDVGMVCGNRFGNESNLRSSVDIFYFGNRLITFVHNFLNVVRLKDPLTGLRVVRWEIVRDWRPKSAGFDVEVELNRFVAKKGFRIVEIPIGYRQRLGEKKLKLWHGFTILRRVIFR